MTVCTNKNVNKIPQITLLYDVLYFNVYFLFVLSLVLPEFTATVGVIIRQLPAVITLESEVPLNSVTEPPVPGRLTA